MKTTAPYIIVLISCFLLGMPAIARQRDPASFLPAAYRGSAGQDTGSMAGIPWRQFFANEELTALVDTALKNNNDLQIAIKHIEIAGQSYKVARMGHLPDIKLAASASLLNPSDNSLNGLTAELLLNAHHIKDYTLGAGLSWEADIWGKVKNQQKEALARFLQTQEARKAIQTSLVAAIAQGYYNLLLLDRQLQVAQQNYALSDSTWRLVQAQYKAAQVTLLAVQQAEAQKLTAAQLIPAIEQEIAIQETALCVLTGVAPAAVKRKKQLEEITLPGVSGGVPASLLGSRPDVRSAELALRASTARVGYTRANMYPSLTISATGGINAFSASEWFNLPESLFGMVAGSIAQPIFQKRKLRTQYEIAKLEREQNVLRFRQSMLQAAGEVADALVAVQKLEQRQAAAATEVDILQQATRHAGLLFTNGRATYLEVLTAQGNLLAKELQQASLRQARLSALIALYRSLGGGWQ